jgi:hypothetical protein
MVSLLDISLKEWQANNLEYLRYEYDLTPDDHVIDIGSYRREFADTIISKYGCKVECFDALDQRAAWTKDGTIELGGQYYYTSAFDSVNKQTFCCVDIAPYLTSEIALCKINIEGMEYELIDYIVSKGLIKNIKNLQVQCHLIDENTQSIYERMAEKLTLTHSINWRYPFCWENWKRND